jgi:hypothetical protein
MLVKSVSSKGDAAQQFITSWSFLFGTPPHVALMAKQSNSEDTLKPPSQTTGRKHTSGGHVNSVGYGNNGELTQKVKWVIAELKPKGGETLL